MLRNIASAMVISAFALAGIAPAHAGSDQLNDPSLYDHDPLGKRSEFVTGAYFRLPFRGGLDPKTDRSEPRFGFAMSSNFANRGRFRHSIANPNARRLIDLSMGFSGRDSLKLNGVHLTGENALYADEGANKKKSSAPWIVLGVLAAGGAIAFVVTEGDPSSGDGSFFSQ